MGNRINVDGYTYDYDTSTNNLVLTKYTGTDTDIITPIPEEYNRCTLTINTVPLDATVTLTATGYTQQGNYIEVEPGTSVTYTVSREGYHTVGPETITVSSTRTIDVNLVPYEYTLTIIPTPDDATVKLTATGYTQVGNSITVPYGTIVTCKVNKLTYLAYNALLTVTQDETRQITLHRESAMGIVYNHGTCAICFAAKLRIYDLEWVVEDYESATDAGLVTNPRDRKLDCGSI